MRPLYRTFVLYAPNQWVYLISDNCVREYTLWLSGRALDYWPVGPGSIPTKVTGFFSALFAMLCSLLRLSCRKMGACPGSIPTKVMDFFSA